MVKKTFSKWSESHCLPGVDLPDVCVVGRDSGMQFALNFQANDTERLWLRFVDGAPSIAKHTQLLFMLENVNKQNTAITFTMEVDGSCNLCRDC